MDAKNWQESAVVAARLGDTTAFAALTEHFYSMVHALALSITRDSDAAEDLAQEVFLLAWAHLNTLRNAAAFQVWLRRIARNASYAWLRDLGYRKKLAGHLMREMHETEEPPVDPVSSTARRECLEQIGGHLERLPSKLREAIIMYYFEGNDMHQSAELLGINVETLKKRLQLGRSQLNERYHRRAKVEEEHPILQQFLPYAARPYAQRIMAGLACGPVSAKLHGSTGSGLSLCVDHLRNGGSWAALRGAGLVSVSRKSVGLAMLLVSMIGFGGVFVSPLGSRAPVVDHVKSHWLGFKPYYYEGVGMLRSEHWDDPLYGNYLLVEEVFPGYPSALAGLKAGDRIVKLDGKPLTREAWDSWQQHLRGHVGTAVRVTAIRRLEDGSEKSLDFQVVRGRIPQAVYDKAAAKQAAQAPHS